MARDRLNGLVEVQDGVLVGRSPTLDQIEWLTRDRGVRALVNLNTEGEPGELLSPNVEATWAHAFALVHARASMDPEHPSEEDVDTLLEALDQAPRPVYVHSLGGRRAAALAALYRALERGESGEEVWQDATRLGLDAGSEGWHRFLVHELERHRDRSGHRPGRRSPFRP